MKQLNLTQQRVFEKEELQAMTDQQKKYAQEQLRNIFSYQMSKITSALSKKQKVAENLIQIEQQEQQQIKNRFKKLNQKIENVDRKRKQQLEKKIKSCKLHDERWQKKIQKIDQKMKLQDQQAEIKLKKYKEQYQSYLNRKKFLANQIDLKRKQTQNNSFFKKNQTIYDYQTYRHRSIVKRQDTQTNKKLFRSINEKNPLDESIKQHKMKSKLMEQEKNEEIFQKALVKLQTIKQRRQKINSLLRKSRSKSGQISKPRINSIEKFENEQRKKYHLHVNSEDTYIQKSLKPSIKSSFDHIQVKNQRQYRQFLQRGEILEKNIKRTKKDQILKQIKSKVTQFKLFAQRSQKN